MPAVFHFRRRTKTLTLWERVCVAFPLVVMFFARQVAEAHLREKQRNAGVHLIRITVHDFLREVKTIDVPEPRQQLACSAAANRRARVDDGLGEWSRNVMSCT